jgi:DNA-binding CsgD family transcriptional regulator
VLKQRLFIQRLSIFLFLSIAILLIFIIYQMRLRSRLKDIALTKLEQEQVLALNDKNLMELQLESRNRLIEQQKLQLVASALDTAQRNDILAKVLAEAKKSNETATIQLLQKIQMDENHWDLLIHRFAELHPSFLAQLSDRYPELSRNDLEFCALVKLNISYKDIASLLHISHRSVFTKKYRITQKMHVSEENDFLEIIRSIN